MRNFIVTAAAAFVSAGLTSVAGAQEVVECSSTNYQYNECYAGSLASPQLIHQISSSACILNRSWGYNPRSGYIWVGQGCSGTFADVGGYHHGRGDTFDPGARHYDSRGRDAGLLVGGAVLGAVLGGVFSGGDGDQHPSRSRSHYYPDAYDGCHGSGCLVNNPDDDGGGPPEPAQGQPEFN